MVSFDFACVVLLSSEEPNQQSKREFDLSRSIVNFTYTRGQNVEDSHTFVLDGGPLYGL